VRLRYPLQREGVEPLPSDSSVYRALVRSGLVEERGRPMELWQMDVVGGVLLADGTECKILTGIDDHSRFMVCAGIITTAIGRQVCGPFGTALEKYGAPISAVSEKPQVVTWATSRPVYAALR
jgi:hypothetical protein